MQLAYNEEHPSIIEINQVWFHSFALKKVDYFKNLLEFNNLSENTCNKPI